MAYTLKSGENADHLVAYYLAEDGSFEKLPVIYDAATGKATFKTTHFSTFVITHEYSSDFSDVNLRKWFYNEVNTALENGWFKGLTATKFGPDDGMTRAMLVQVLYRMSGSKAASTARRSHRMGLRKRHCQRLHRRQIPAGYADHPSAAGGHPVPLRYLSRSYAAGQRSTRWLRRRGFCRVVGC